MSMILDIDKNTNNLLKLKSDSGMWTQATNDSKKLSVEKPKFKFRNTRLVSAHIRSQSNFLM